MLLVNLRVSSWYFVVDIFLIIFLNCIEPTLIAKSNIILDVKPWDDETDMKELEKAVRQVVTDGLLWGACKLFLYFVILFYYILIVFLNSFMQVYYLN